ncbi:surface antigen-like protein [Novymonas esmeraldas]|uniref:Surface antigen-like protein n=1 Tax=Novymonas esmeraldas TaxID=1808958 RepID=A0AAW0EZC3_9TRYP
MSSLLIRAAALVAVAALLCAASAANAATVSDSDTTYFVKLWSGRYPLNYVWSGNDICKYEGISCDTVKQTVTMLLPRIGLKGTIPSFGSRSSFTPGNVKVITVNLMSNTQLTGAFPAHYGQVTRLQELYLMNTSLSGTIPQAWNNLANLVILDVSNTKACGNLPSWDVTSMKSLQYMHFTSNSLMRGSVPASLATFGAVSFNTSGCNLCGCLPSEFRNSIYMAIQIGRDQPQLNTQSCSTTNACKMEDLNCNSKTNAAALGQTRAGVAAVVASVLVAVAALVA